MDYFHKSATHTELRYGLAHVHRWSQTTCGASYLSEFSRRKSRRKMIEPYSVFFLYTARTAFSASPPFFSVCFRQNSTFVHTHARKWIGLDRHNAIPLLTDSCFVSCGTKKGFRVSEGRVQSGPRIQRNRCAHGAWYKYCGMANRRPCILAKKKKRGYTRR